MRVIVTFVLTLVWLFSALMPADGASDKPKRGGTLTVAIRKDLVLMNPLVNTQSTEQSIRDLVFEPLLGLDLKGNIRPYLAESWRISDDGKIYTFNLRKGVKFHNGQEMTAEDAKFAIDYTMNPKNGAYGLSRLNGISRVETPDKYTLRIHLNSPSPAFLSLLTDIQSFSVIPRGSLQPGINQLAKFPPGTGPFTFAEWQPGQRIVFDRFNDYWGQKAWVDRVALKPIDSATIRVTALRAGDVDVTERTAYEWVTQIVEGKLRGLGFVQAPYAGFRRITFNVTDPPFNNKKLRFAIAHAIDKKELLKGAYFGFGEPTDQKYPKGHAWYFEGLPSPSYDLEKAKSLLREAGYKGEPIAVLTHKGEERETEATILQAQLKKVGINVKLDLMEYGTYNDRQRKGDFAMEFRGGNYKVDPFATYQPDLTCQPDLKKRSANQAGYCDKKMEALLKRAENEINPEKRKELFRQIAAKDLDDLSELNIGFVPRFFTFRDHVKGFVTNGDGSFVWFENGFHRAWLDK